MLPSFSLLEHDVHFFRRPEVSGLIIEEAPTKILAKYLDFVDIFFSNLTSKFPEHTRINDYTIKPVNGQQLLYELIYSLETVELEILKAYIKTNLANRFIRLSKSPVGTPILFD